MGKQLESLQYVIFLKSPDGEITEVFGESGYSRGTRGRSPGNRSGWYKAALIFGCVVLAGLVVLTVAISGESNKLLR